MDIELVNFTGKDTGFKQAAKDAAKTLKELAAAGEGLKVLKATFEVVGKGASSKLISTVKTLNALGQAIEYVYSQSAKLDSKGKARGFIPFNDKDNPAKLLSTTVSQSVIDLRKAETAKINAERRLLKATISLLKEQRRVREQAAKEAKAQQAKDLADEQNRANAVFRLRMRMWEREKREADKREREEQRREERKRAAQRRFLREVERATAENERQQRSTQATATTGSFINQLGGISGKATDQGLFNVANARKQLDAVLVKGQLTQQQINAVFRAVQSGSAAAFGTMSKAEQEAYIATLRLVRAMNTLNTAGKRTQDIMISWQGLIRIFTVQQLHRIIGVGTTEFWKGVEAAGEYGKQIANIQTISQNAKMTTDAWRASLTKLSNSYGVPAAEVAASAYDAISNQMGQGASSIQFLAEALDFAKASASTADQAINLLSATLNSYGQSTIHANDVAAKMFKLIDLGRVRAGDLANTFGNTTALASNLGVSLDELNAGIATLTINGIRSDTAMTLMNNIFLKMLKPTEEMSSLMAEWGVNSGEAAIQTFGFIGVLQRLEQEANRGGATRLGELFKDMRAIRGGAGLVGGGAFDRFTEVYNKMTSASDEYNKAIELTSQTLDKRLNIQMTKFNNTMQQQLSLPILKHWVEFSEALDKTNISTEGLAQGLTNTLKIGLDLTYWLTTVVGAVGEFNSIIPAMVNGLAAFTLASMAAKVRLVGLTAALRAFHLAWLTASGGIGLAVGAIAGTAAYLYSSHLNHLQDIENAVLKVEQKLSESNSKYTELVNRNLKKTSDEQTKAVNKQLQQFNQMVATFRSNNAPTITPKSDTLMGIEQSIFNRSLGGLSEMGKISRMTGELNRQLRDIEALRLDKQFDAASDAMEKTAEYASSINDEIAEISQGLADSIKELETDKATRAFDNSLLGLSDKSKAKKIQEEINKITASAEELFDSGNQSEGLAQLERAFALSEKLIDVQAKIKEDAGLTATPKNTTGFSIQEDIINKQIEAQKKYKELIDSQVVDEMQLYNDKIKAIEEAAAATKRFEENVNLVNQGFKEIVQNAEKAADALKQSKSDSRGQISSSVAQIEQFIATAGDAPVKSLGINDPTVKGMGRLNVMKDELLRMLQDEKTPIAELESKFKALASTYLEISDSVQYVVNERNRYLHLSGPSDNIDQVTTDTTSKIKDTYAVLETLKSANVDYLNANTQLTQGIQALSAASAGAAFNVDAVTESIKKIYAAASSVQGTVTGQANGGVPGFGSGGMIGGPLGRDNRLFRGHAGEFIMSAEATKRFTPQLVAMNSGYTRNITNSPSSTVSVGSVHVHANVQDGRIDSQAIGRQLQRDLRRGVVKWN